MTATTKLLNLELKLLSRDLGAMIFGVLFPTILLLVLGALPGFTDPDPELGGYSLIELYTPIVLILTFAMVGVSSLSSYLASYRKEGVLRRLRVTPVGPAPLLAAQFAAQLLLALGGSTLAIAATTLAFGLPGPASWLGVIAGLGLAAACLFAVGTVLGALAPSPTAVGAIAPLVWLPIMVLAGLWFPREVMPDLMRRVSDLSPGGAAVDAVTGAWFSGVTETSSLVVLAVSTVVLGTAAVMTFRWE